MLLFLLVANDFLSVEDLKSSFNFKFIITGICVLIIICNQISMIYFATER